MRTLVQSLSNNCYALPPIADQTLQNGKGGEVGMKIHELKILPEYFDAVRCGDKRFEIRKNDRNFQRGDILRLKEFDGKEYTGEEIDVFVRYVLYDWPDGLQDGYCIMSIDNTMMRGFPRRKAALWE